MAGGNGTDGTSGTDGTRNGRCGVKAKRVAVVDEGRCVACGTCGNECPLGAIAVAEGWRAVVDAARCVGCGRCAKMCPAGCIEVREREAAE